MKCPYCLETMASEALVCKYCGRDVQLVADLKARLAKADSELADFRERLLSGQVEPSTQTPSSPSRPFHSLEIGAVIATTALFAIPLYGLRSFAHLPAVAYFAIVVASSCGAGFLVGYRGVGGKVAWLLLGICQAVLQVMAISLAFGYACRMYYLGVGEGWQQAAPSSSSLSTVSSHSVAWWVGQVLQDYGLWLSAAVPAFLLFIVFAFVGRSMFNRIHLPPRSTLGSVLAGSFTSRRPQEALASFQERLEGYIKLFDGFTHFIVVVLSILSMYFLVAKQANRPAADPPGITSSATDSK